MKWIAALLVVAALAGCTAEDGPRYASFEDALAAPGTDFEVGNLTVRVLEPHPLEGQRKGETEVVLLVHDGQAPVTDASIFMAADMPAMGHGTDGEEMPTHTQHGVYVGKTDLFMPGQWVIDFALEQRDMAFQVTVQVQ